MKKSYILVYSNSLGTREQVKSCLDNMTEVTTWRYDMPNSFYIISENTANEITNRIITILGDHRFLVTEISKNRQGRLPKDSWYLIREKKHRKK